MKNLLNIFDSKKYLDLALKNRKKYLRSKPFPHIYFDNFLPRKLAITLSKEYPKIKNVDKVDVLKGKGVVSDRKFRENNDKNCQITIIEIENIKYFNNKNKTNIAPAEFRRNIISKDIRLNELLGREFKIGMVKVKAHDLCRPCKYLQDKLKQNNPI